MSEEIPPDDLEVRRLRYAGWLQALVGLPLTDMWRPIGQDFDFGTLDENRRAPATLRLLHGWRVARGGRTILGSGDHEERGARRFYDRKTPPRDPGERARWRAAKAFFAEVAAGTLVVAAVEVSSAFEPRLRMTDGTTIEGANNSSHWNVELWWFQDGERSALVFPDGDNGLTDGSEDD